MSKPKILSDIEGLQDTVASLGTLVNTNSIQISNIYDQIGSSYVPMIASTLHIGEEFYLYESGNYVPFIVVHKDYGNSENIICVRKHLLPTLIYNNNSMLVYTGSNLDEYLEDTYKSTVEVTYSPVTIQTIYTSGSSGTASRSVFAPSLTEMTGETFYVNSVVSEGYQFSYFLSNDSRLATYEDTIRDYHLRTLSSSSYTYYINTSGRATVGPINTPRYVRPCLSIDKSSRVYMKLLPSTSNVLATAVVTE